MGIFKRALISMRRRPRKSLVLLTLVFVLGVMISGAVSLERAVQRTEANLREQLPPLAAIYFDLEEFNHYIHRSGEVPEIESVTLEMIRQMGELDIVRHLDYWAGFLFEGLELIASHDDFRFNHNHYNNHNQFPIRGVSRPDFQYLREGVIELVDGRTFTEAEINEFDDVIPALIFKSLAEVNGFTIGSRFTLEHRIYDFTGGIDDYLRGDFEIFASQVHEFEVIGIVDSTHAIGNTIYVPSSLAITAQNFHIEKHEALGINLGFDSVLHEPVFTLYDSQDLPVFEERLAELLPPFWAVYDLSSTYVYISNALENVNWLMTWVLFGSAVASVLILGLLITLFLRDRKHELGVYLALGEKKVTLMMQILVEVMAVSAIAMTLSLMTGHFLAGTLSDSMIRADLVAQQECMEPRFIFAENARPLFMFSDGDMSIEDMLSHFETSLDATTILVFYAVGLSTVLISTLAPMGYLVKLNPKKILM